MRLKDIANSRMAKLRWWPRSQQEYAARVRRVLKNSGKKDRKRLLEMLEDDLAEYDTYLKNPDDIQERFLMGTLDDVLEQKADVELQISVVKAYILEKEMGV